MEQFNLKSIGKIYVDDKGSHILNIKTYIPSLDRVENPLVPKWYSNWPKNVKEAEKFDWSTVFNF